MTNKAMATECDWSVYIVRCADGSLYTGIAKDIDARIAQHNRGKGAKYTRSRTPVALVYRENGISHSEALRRELEIKKLRKKDKFDLLGDADANTLAGD